MGAIQDSIDRYTALLAEMDAKISAMGAVEYKIGSVWERFSEKLQSDRDAIDAKLSKLKALRDSGSRTVVGRGRF